MDLFLQCVTHFFIQVSARVLDVTLHSSLLWGFSLSAVYLTSTTGLTGNPLQACLRYTAGHVWAKRFLSFLFWFTFTAKISLPINYYNVYVIVSQAHLMPVLQARLPLVKLVC